MMGFLHAPCGSHSTLNLELLYSLLKIGQTRNFKLHYVLITLGFMY
jgi:hypothetical protein